MPKMTLSFILLTLVCSRQRALEIEGDLVEEYPTSTKIGVFFQSFQVILWLFYQDVKRSPAVVLCLGLAGLMAISALSIILLFPIIFKFNDFSYPLLLAVVGSFRALACFVIGGAMVALFPRFGRRALVMTSILVLLMLIVRGAIYSQQWVVTMDVLLGIHFVGICELLAFYLVCSFGPLLAGGIYVHGRGQQAYARSAYDRIGRSLG